MIPNSEDGYLIWYPEYGYGHHTAPPMEYDSDYWESYLGRDDSDMGKELTCERIAFVQRHYSGEVVDIGIGGGRFVDFMDCKGFDVNEKAIEWLKSVGAWHDPYLGCSAITCWDSLEHIPEPEKLIECVSEWVFVSMPTYNDVEHCLNSPHYKPGEHIWYWTHEGLIDWFERLGFELAEENDIESQVGRREIYSYAFKRVGDGRRA